MSPKGHSKPSAALAGCEVTHRTLKRRASQALSQAEVGSQQPLSRSGGLASAAIQSELQMFAAVEDFLRREYERLHALPPAFRPQAQIAELKVRSHQLILDVTRWMEREAQA